ncbi:MAG: TonB family protein [Burkholderiales bacterium]|nr:TonB family protein [Burkholderiales bacterium]
MIAASPKDHAGYNQQGLSRAALAALVIEASLVAAFGMGLAEIKPVAERSQEPITLSFPVPPAPVPVPPAPAKPVQPQQPHPRSVEHPAPAHPIEHQPVQPIKPVVPPLDESKPPPVIAAPPPPTRMPAPDPVPPVKADPEIQPGFEDKVRSAVQSAVSYPYAAKLAHITGRTKVSFIYRDGNVRNIKVIITSSSSVIDAAAIRAVSDARYPAPSKEWVGKDIPFNLWVRFSLSADLQND